MSAVETINPGMFFTGMAAVALLAFATTVGRSYQDTLRREVAALRSARWSGVAAGSTARAAAPSGRPQLTVLRGGAADTPPPAADRPRESPRAA